MLGHEDNQTSVSNANKFVAGTDSAAAENARVTADEFTAALRAIESRRSADAAQRAETVEVGETIRELGIDASPEQILAEVEAIRARNSEQEKTKTDVRAKAQQAASDAWDYASAAYQTIRERMEEAAQQTSQAKPGSPIHVNVNVKAPREHTRFHNPLPGLVFGLLFSWILMSAVIDTQAPTARIQGVPILRLAPGPTLHIGDESTFRLTQIPTTPGSEMALSQAPEGETVYCDTSGIVKMSADGGTVGGGAGAVTVMTNRMDNSWPILRFGDRIYVEGYTLPGAVETMPVGVTHIYNNDAAGELQGNQACAVTVPLSGSTVTVASTQSDWSELLVEPAKHESAGQ
jgi:hypothetical protein